MTIWDYLEVVKMTKDQWDTFFAVPYILMIVAVVSRLFR